MQYIHQITRSFLILGLLAFALAVGFSGMALADEKAAETKAASEAPADGGKKAEGEAPADGGKKAEGEAPADGGKKAEGEAKASDAK